MGLGFGGGVGLSGLVDGNHPELVPLALAQAGHACLQLVDGGCAVLVVCDEGIEPASELVFLLDDVMRNWATTILFWLVPSESDRFVVKVNNLWLTRLAGRS